jgi:type VI secretion system protein ImpA
MNVDDWLRDTEVEPPCGPNLEYDDAFMSLMAAGVGKPEQQYGDTIIPAEAPDWKGVLDQSTRLLERTKDLRATLLLTRALTHVQGLPGFVAGLVLARRLLDEHWDDAHPRLVVDGEADPVMRANALAGLADDAGVLKDLRAAMLISTPVGAISVRNAEAVLKREPGGDGMTEAQLAQAAAAALAANQPSLLAVPTALEQSRALQALVDARMGTDAPDLAPLVGVFETIGRLVAPKMAESASTAGAPLADGAGEAVAMGAMRSRQDALRALDAVCEFLSRNEPSNPAPLLIRRAQRLIGSDFLDIMRDLAPESLVQINAIAGLKSDVEGTT